MSQDLSVEVVPLAEIPLTAKTEKYRPVVLVVDDEEVITITLAAILSNNGFAPLTAFDGKSALEMAEVIPPEVVISDVMMPGMTGVELAIELTRRFADCHVLLFSGQSATTDLVAEARANGHDFTLLQKPVHPDVLLARVRECLRIQKPVSGGLDEQRAVRRAGERAAYFASTLF